ncbi:putative hydrophobic protein (TIGR00271 family) [Actinocorallia herbida]|uniref:Putative hydrophobic protein (TIGR00271 family) n=1 Tax=Actinocorallia herbida TaxID=58109 RepID=A0A3N1CVW7_9ACTN|nr:DUF389 domain-containing protein [Actinocorallia herbida]ROO85452.1 putative hydrophobic protein (TIGR00271 family) [Actinocorallia herbida]
MTGKVREWIVPAAQRRTLAELDHDLDLASPDRTAERSAFWTMLLLSSVIAASGVLSDSTATVIGAMIIAPLSTPIMGVAVGLVRRARGGAGRFVVGGAVAVVAVGLMASLVVPKSYDLLSNGQISGRTSPGLTDLLGALATGLAGAVALARRDVGAVLPGVAIAISLVPPLVVVGVCLGDGAVTLALGAFVLFLSNVLSMVLAGAFVFAVLDRASSVVGTAARGRTVFALGGLGVVVTLLLVANTALTCLMAVWENRVKTAATAWLAGTPGASVTGVSTAATTFRVSITTPAEPPPTADLLVRLDGTVPDRFSVVVEATRGRTESVGTVGEG